MKMPEWKTVMSDNERKAYWAAYQQRTDSESAVITITVVALGILATIVLWGH